MLLQQQNLPSSQLGGLILSLEGIDRARCVAIASFTIILYDYCSTLDDEIKYFWSGKWSLSRVLFLFNRYLAPITMIIILICFLATDLSEKFCNRATRASFTLAVLATIIIQAVLVLRIWYLYKHSKTARVLVITSLCTATLAQCVALIIPFKYLHSEILVEPGVSILRLGCIVPPPQNIWPIFVSPVILHTVLYLFTAYRAVMSDSITSETLPLMNRLLRDGGILYLTVFISVGFSTIGAAMIQDPLISIPAIYSNFMVAINSVCVSRIMLGMRSLATDLISDSTLALNSVELSTVPWQRSPRTMKPTPNPVDNPILEPQTDVIDIRGGIDCEADVVSTRGYHKIGG